MRQSLVVYLNPPEEEGFFIRTWDCDGLCPWSISNNSVVLRDPTETISIPMTSIRYYSLSRVA